MIDFKFLSKIMIFNAILGISGCASKNVRNDFTIPAEEKLRGGKFTEGNWVREPESDAAMGHLENPSVETAVSNEKILMNESSPSSNGSEEKGIFLISSQEFYGDKDAVAKARNKRTRKTDFIDDSKGDGSLWTSDGQTNYYLTKNKVKTAGDLITVTADEEFLKMVAIEIKRNLTPEEKQYESNAANMEKQKEMLAKQTEAAGGRTPAAAGEEPKKEDLAAASVPWEEVDLKKYVELKVGDPVMAEVVQRYPNGNYKLRGVKKVRFRNSLRYLSFLGVAKQNDVSEEDTIAAGKLYEYRLESFR